VTRVDPIDYATGSVTPEERREAERLMREDPDFRAGVERMREVVALLEEMPGETWDPPEPPPLRLEGLTPAKPARAPAPGRRRRRWSLQLPAPVLALGAAALLAGGAVLGALVAGDGDGPAEPAVERDVRLAAFGSGGPQATGDARILADGELALDVSGLAPSGDRDFYSVWLLGADGELVPLGSFRVPEGGAASLRVPLPEDPTRFAFVDVSREPADGNPGHSGDSVLRGETA
jgi:anti-sigma-K factor RskA